MAKDEQSNQLNLTVVALVALVAIVGLVALVMNAAKLPTGSKLASASGSQNAAGGAMDMYGCYENGWGGVTCVTPTPTPTPAPGPQCGPCRRQGFSCQECKDMGACGSC